MSSLVSSPRWPRGSVWLLGFGLAFPSLGTVEKYTSTAVAVAYFAAVLVVVPLVVGPWLPLALRLLSGRRAAAAALLTYVALVVAFLVVYPRADAGSGLSGSDRDEAANLAAGNLLDGRWPYDGLTYLGNPVSDLPGAVLLATPFEALGNSAYANLLWIALGFAGLSLFLGSTALAVVASWTALALSPALLREYVTGGDLLPNCIWVTLLVLLVLWAARRPAPAALVASSLALGFSLSSRANFVFVVPLLVAAVRQHAGTRRAVASAALAAAAFAAVTLPFYLWNRDGFTPTKTVNHLRQFEDVLPHAATLVVAAAAVLSLVLALGRLDARGDAVLRRAAVVQALLVVVPVVLASVRARGLDFSFLIAGFGVPVAVFAVFGCWGAFREVADAVTVGGDERRPSGERATRRPAPTPLA